MTKTIEAIFETLDKIEKLIADKDPKRVAWDLRVASMHDIFMAFDSQRFRMAPAEPEAVLKKLDSLKLYIEQTPSAKMAPQKISLKTFVNRDKKMQYLYGLAFNALSQKEYRDAADLLRLRLEKSGKDTFFLKDAECLDIATGIGRWALAMVQLGAKKVIGIDFSKYCLREARRRLKGCDESNKIILKHMDLYKLPGEWNEAFDFVCANGVIHHIPNPFEGLRIMARCVKKGGYAFTFVFSRNNAPYWPSIELMRKIAEPVPLDYANLILKSHKVPGRKIFNILDYSYTPIQHKLERKEVEENLHSLFSDVQFLEGGSIHDSALRCKLFETDRELFGISEIRYLLRK